MRKALGVVTATLFLSSLPALADDEAFKRELELLKQRIEQLEKKLAEKNQKETEIAKEVSEIREKLESFELHGGVVGYYQGAAVNKIDGEKFSNPSGVGYVADLELTFKPSENGEFYMRLHGGEGKGADEINAFANLNTLADDNPENEATFKLLEAYYTHEFLDGKLLLSIGKTEPPVFIDDNEFANDEYSQFVGKPFVNNPIIDGEFQFAPIIGVVFSPTEQFEIAAVVQSNEQTGISWDGTEWVVNEKSLYDNVFDNPFYAVQLKYSPEINGLPGNYRIYFWNDSAEHIKVGQPTDNPAIKPSTDEGWGVGISLDQKLTENAGIFARVAFANDEVYEVEQFYSFGASINGLIPSRPDDTLGLGIAALIPNDKLENDDTEYHFEGYYRVQISENFAITPDVQYVVNPHGNSSNDNIFAGMIKAEFSF
jgi:cell division septum initiation protein DivIVA